MSRKMIALPWILDHPFLCAGRVIQEILVQAGSDPESQLHPNLGSHLLYIFFWCLFFLKNPT